LKTLQPQPGPNNQTELAARLEAAKEAKEKKAKGAEAKE
jgi:hypothetical protein